MDELEQRVAYQLVEWGCGDDPTCFIMARAIIPMVLEKAAKVAERRHEQWRLPHPDDAEDGEVCCDVTACADIAAAIRAIGASHERG